MAAKLTEADARRIKELILLGKSKKYIAEVMGVSETTIRRKASAFGLTFWGKKAVAPKAEVYYTMTPQMRAEWDYMHMRYGIPESVWKNWDKTTERVRRKIWLRKQTKS